MNKLQLRSVCFLYMKCRCCCCRVQRSALSSAARPQLQLEKATVGWKSIQQHSMSSTETMWYPVVSHGEGGQEHSPPKLASDFRLLLTTQGLLLASQNSTHIYIYSLFSEIALCDMLLFNTASLPHSLACFPWRVVHYLHALKTANRPLH